jgi:AcrR family transcriptional regulator
MARRDAAVTPGAGAATRREQAVARVLDPVRVRAESRVQRFLDAALELMSVKGNDFTVQEVVERSGQSLRGFYQHFDGKYELLLTLFEDTVARSAAQVAEAVAAESTPLDRLHRFAVDYYQMCRPHGAKGRKGRETPPALADFAQQLLNEHPQEASRAFLPMIDMLEALLVEAAAAGVVRSGLRYRRIAGFTLQSIMFNAYISSINSSWASGDDAEAAEDMWNLLFCGLAADS